MCAFTLQQHFFAGAFWVPVKCIPIWHRCVAHLYSRALRSHQQITNRKINTGKFFPAEAWRLIPDYLIAPINHILLCNTLPHAFYFP